MSKKVWIIGTGGNELDGVDIERVCGTAEQVKRYLCSLVRDAADDMNSPSDFEYGTEEPEDVEERFNGSLYAYACFDSYHLDFEAHPEGKIRRL